MRRPIIAIDGPTASGKSTAGKALAARLGFVYIDTGAMYRAVGLAALEAGVSLDDAAGLETLARRIVIRFAGDPSHPAVTLDGRDVTAAIRTPAVDEASSKVSTVPGVRAAMVDQQRDMGLDGGIVMDGRDIGTHVFPDAEVKVFLVADPDVRARRRYDENVARGRDESLETTSAAVADRDLRDTSRNAAPLRPAENAIHVDTTHMTPAELLDRLLDLVRASR